MYTKSMRVKDVNGNEVVIGGEEIFRAYKDLVQWFMETRFVWIFKILANDLIELQSSIVRENVLKS
jgi:hypothetical protein